jgi:hypothetical protein
LVLNSFFGRSTNGPFFSGIEIDSAGSPLFTRIREKVAESLRGEKELFRVGDESK